MNKKFDTQLYKLRANREADSENYQTAYIKLTRVLKRQPQDLDALHQITGILNSLCKYRAAEVRSRTIIMLGLRSSFVYLLRGAILKSLERYHEAEIALKTSLEYQPYHETTHRYLATVLTKLGRYSEAFEFCERSIELRSSEYFPYNIKGYLYLLMGDYDKAVASIDEAIRLDPKECITYMNKAIVYHLMKKKEETMETLDKIKSLVVDGKKRDFTEEIEIYSLELARLEKQDCKGGEREENQRKACIEGVKFMMNFIESELVNRC